jgi:DNA primase
MQSGSTDLPSLKARLRLSVIIAKAVKLERRGGDHWGPCPFHSEKTASFSVNDAKGFYHCFGCSAHGDVIDWWQLIDGISKAEAIERLKREAGEARPWREEAIAKKADSTEDQANREQALAIWRASLPIGSTIAETYLRKSRRISVPLPGSLRFHPELPIDGIGRATWPALVAGVENLSSDVIAIQRTFIARDGSSKAAVQTPKRSLGGLGEAAVRLGPAAITLGICEGIETGLSAMELFAVPVWCALGSNLARIALPANVRNVVIFADRGEAGEAAAKKAQLHFRSLGRKIAVRFARQGKDFNDELKALRNGGS